MPRDFLIPHFEDEKEGNICCTQHAIYINCVVYCAAYNFYSAFVHSRTIVVCNIATFTGGYYDFPIFYASFPLLPCARCARKPASNPPPPNPTFAMLRMNV